MQKYYICSKHFKAEDLKVNAQKTTVRPGKVPSIFQNETLNHDHGMLDSVWPFEDFGLAGRYDR